MKGKPRISRISRIGSGLRFWSALGEICMLHEDITRAVIGASMTVMNELKPGLDDRLYENALVIELTSLGHTVDQQREWPVYFRGRFIGKLIPDLVIDEKVIVDPKVVTAFHESHVAQMLGYLNITGLQVALLINFKESKITWKRIVNERRSINSEEAEATDTS